MKFEITGCDYSTVTDRIVLTVWHNSKTYLMHAPRIDVSSLESVKKYVEREINTHQFIPDWTGVVWESTDNNEQNKL